MVHVSRASTGEMAGLGVLALTATAGCAMLAKRSPWLALSAKVGLGAGTVFAYRRDQAGEASRLTNCALVTCGGVLIGDTLVSTYHALGQLLVCYKLQLYWGMEVWLANIAFDIGVLGLCGAKMVRTGLCQARGEGWPLEAHARWKQDHTAGLNDDLASTLFAMFTEDAKGKELVLNRAVHRVVKKYCSTQFHDHWTIDALTRYWAELTREEQSYALNSLQGWGIERKDLASSLANVGLACEPPIPALFGIVEHGAEGYGELLQILEVKEGEDLADRVQSRIDQLGLSSTAWLADLPDAYDERVAELKDRLVDEVRRYKICNDLQMLPDVEGAIEHEDDLNAAVDDLVDYFLGRGRSYSWGMGAVAFALGCVCLSLHVVTYAHAITSYPRASALGAWLGVWVGSRQPHELGRGERVVAVARLLRDEIADDDLLAYSVASEVTQTVFRQAKRILFVFPACVGLGVLNIYTFSLWGVGRGINWLLGPVGAFSICGLAGMLIQMSLIELALWKITLWKTSSTLDDAEALIKREGGAQVFWNQGAQYVLTASLQ